MPHRRRLTGACIAAMSAGLLATGAGIAYPTASVPASAAAVPAPAAARAPNPAVTVLTSPPASPAAPPAAQPPAPRGAQPPAHRTAEPAVGAFLDSGVLGVQRIGGLSRWLGGANLRVGHTYLPGDTWAGIEGRVGFLQSWARWRRAEADRMFVLNVPMQQHNEDRVSDDQVRGLLKQGARGDFDSHYRKLAKRLVGLGLPDTVIVLGWEMNGTTYTHRCGPDPQAWKTYWNRIVTTMRSVHGQKFRFDFAPNRGPDAIPWTRCYPGDDTVDIIGMDSYDQPPGHTFDEQVKGAYGLQAQVDFAAAHKKQISYPEWGLFKNGDDTEYMRRMLAWFDRHKPLYQTITDYCPHGVWQCGTNPHAAKIFRTKIAAETGGDPAAQTNEPPPGTGTDPGTGPRPDPDPSGTGEWCLPIDLGGGSPAQVCAHVPVWYRDGRLSTTGWDF
ncbi:glycosyl hydrolase [Streptomyces sp. NPDC051320]|uniref:glycoside hydrolase family 26 protein n=1 Tax=Streptomyces sp. NPDC051320 TaxID=3154644 RepID=UPI0034379D26